MEYGKGGYQSTRVWRGGAEQAYKGDEVGDEGREGGGSEQNKEKEIAKGGQGNKIVLVGICIY